MGEIYTKVAGVTFNNSDGTSRQRALRRVSENDTLNLKDDSSERYPEAIGVYDSKGGQLGFLPSDVAWKVRRYVGNSEIEGIYTVVRSVGSEPGYPLGCHICVKHKNIPNGQTGNQVSENEDAIPKMPKKKKEVVVDPYEESEKIWGTLEEIDKLVLEKLRAYALKAEVPIALIRFNVNDVGYDMRVYNKAMEIRKAEQSRWLLIPDEYKESPEGVEIETAPKDYGVSRRAKIKKAEDIDCLSGAIMSAAKNTFDYYEGLKKKGKKAFDGTYFKSLLMYPEDMPRIKEVYEKVDKEIKEETHRILEEKRQKEEVQRQEKQKIEWEKIVEQERKKKKLRIGLAVGIILVLVVVGLALSGQWKSP